MFKRKRNIILVIITIVFIIAPILVYAKSSNKSKENFANVVFFAYFRGDTEGREYLISHANEILEMYDGTGELSVKGYLNKISYGKFNLINIYPQYNGKELVPIELPCTIAEVENSNLDYTIIHSIISSISGVSDNLDYNNDGYIDNISIILKGGSENASSNSTLVSHKSDYGENESWSNKKLASYNMLNTYSIQNSGAGVITHEFLHTLGYPDLYTYNNSYPVYTWDIMASAGKYMQYPLAYSRMKFTNWLTIDTITTSQTLTLDTQDNPNGNQAYILKSPLNEYELFVIEFRKKATSLDKIDRAISDSGIIVYRINTTVTGLSNTRGKTGIYVFRDESGKKDDSTLRLEAYYGVYSKERGKTTIGSSDLNVTEGALTFSDGSNSGIVISNISSSKGNKMTLDVSIPDAKNYDTWKNTNFNDLAGEDEYTVKNADIISFENKLYAVNVGNNKIYTNYYENNEWKTINSNEMQNSNNINGVSLLTIKKELYLITSSWEKIELYKFENNSWKSIASLADTNGYYDYEIYKDKLYITKVDSESLKVSLNLLENNSFKFIGNYYEGSAGFGVEKGYAGNPKIEVMNDKLYVMNKQSNGMVRMYQVENNKFIEISTNINSNQFDTVSLNNKIYFVLGSDNTNAYMKIARYDGKNFENIDTNIKLGLPITTVSQGNLYVLATDTLASGKTIVYAFDEKTKELTKEGIDVDNSADFGNLKLTSINDNIYVLLKRMTDGKIVVKTKETVNSLKTLTILPPNKTTYIVGEKMDLTGIKVYANYVKEQREITNYNVSGFDSTKSGEYDILIEYEGVKNTFSYTVVEDVKEYKTLKDYLTEAGYKVSESLVSGFKIGEKINDIKGKLKNSDITISSSTSIISTGVEFSYLGEKYTSVLYGDISGDGKINSADLLKMRQHLLGTKTLSGAYKKAAALVNRKTINSADLLRLRQYLLGIKNIEQ